MANQNLRDEVSTFQVFPGELGYKPILLVIFAVAHSSIEHIMRLGGWESLDMVLRYTRSVKFEESLKLYRELKGRFGCGGVGRGYDEDG